MSTHPKCQAANTALCTDPNCPERKGYRTAMSNAKSYSDFETAAKQRDQDLARQRKQQFVTQTAAGRNAGRPRRQETTRDGDPIIKFHTEVGFPYNFTPPGGTRELIYEKNGHAVKEAQNDQYGEIPILRRVNLDKMDLIELKVNQKTSRAYRYLYRGELDDERDICLVMEPTGKKGVWKVVTNWINVKSDAHRSLDRSQYMQPKKREAVA